MIRRTTPKTCETVPAIGLGTRRAFDVGAPNDGHRACLDLLFEAGGGIIDASPIYGLAEGVVGGLLTGKEERYPAFIATKVWTECRYQGIAQMEESLRRFQRGSIDLSCRLTT